MAGPDVAARSTPAPSPMLSTSSCRKAISVTLKRCNSTASGGKFKVVVVGGGRRIFLLLLLNVVV